MIQLSQFSLRNERRGGFRVAAFSLVEILFALTALGIMSGGAYLGFNSVNTYAVSSRLYSEAQAVAQNQIDLILSRGPFNITSTPYRIPSELELGTKVKPNVFIYTDPVTGQVTVTGTMTTVISDLGSTMTFNGVTTDLNIRKAEVTVSYSFRGKSYNVTLNTLRTADQ